MTTPSLLALPGSSVKPISQSGLLLPTTEAAIYTVGSGKIAQIKTATITNVTNVGQVITDAVTTNGSTTLTSATASFTSGDTGKTISGAGIPAGATMTYVSATQVTLSAAATATTTGVAVTLGRTGTAVTVSMSLVRASTSSSLSNRFISNYGSTGPSVIFGPGESLPLIDFLGGSFLGEGDFISGVANQLGSVAFTLTGLEFN